jgi:hypothetical protein
MPNGVFRRVILLGNLAFKVPRLKNFSCGMRCNRWEREMWSKWRPIFGWTNLCQVLFADPFGFLVVMPRAVQPVSTEEAHEALGDDYPGITAETKAQDYGRVGSVVVALDYGLPWADFIDNQRADFRRLSNQA